MKNFNLNEQVAKDIKKAVEDRVEKLELFVANQYGSMVAKDAQKEVNRLKMILLELI